MNSAKIVILGAGTGGLVAANELRRILPQEHQITLIEKDKYHALAPSFLWVMTGARKAYQITRPVARLIRLGIRLVIDEVKGIHLARKSVVTDGTRIPYDYLIVAVGAELAFDKLPGNDPDMQTFFTLDGAVRLHERLREFRGGKIAVVVTSIPYKCPGAPHEGVMLIADHLRRKLGGVNGEIHLFTPEPQPLPVAGPELGAMVRNVLESRGIEFHPRHRLSGFERKTLRFDGSQDFEYDMLIMIPPHRSPKFVRESALVNESGWIPVHEGSLSTKYENVYAVGDVAAVPLPGRWATDVPLALPKAGVFAHSQALIVSKRIAGEIMGRRSDAKFCGDGYCMLEAGEDVAGFAYGNFFAEPSPDVRLRRMGRNWHLGKVLFEKWWLAPFGLRRALLRSVITAGGKLLGFPLEL